LAKGALPLDHALAIAIQIADALDPRSTGRVAQGSPIVM
jgi:hypothetical protein